MLAVAPERSSIKPEHRKRPLHLTLELVQQPLIEPNQRRRPGIRERDGNLRRDPHDLMHSLHPRTPPRHEEALLQPHLLPNDPLQVHKRLI